MQRRILEEVSSLLREGDTVVASKFFRLGRSRDHLINLVGDFARKGIVFKALDRDIDSSTPAEKMIIGIFCIVGRVRQGTDPGEDKSWTAAGKSERQY